MESIDLPNFGPDKVTISLDLEARSGRECICIRYPFGKYGDQITFLTTAEIPALVDALQLFQPVSEGKMVIKPQDLMVTPAQTQAELDKLVFAIESRIKQIIQDNYSRAGIGWRGQTINLSTQLFGDDPFLKEKAIAIFEQNGWQITLGQKMGGMDERDEPWYEIKPK